jgi:NADPH:quinone reductase-like Zn-dependent oxidoreductase
MKAIICPTYGPPDVLKIEEVAKPVPKANEILINIKASTVNSGDVRVRGLQVSGFLKLVMRFVLGFTGPRKKILGTVYAGVVEETGKDIKRFKTGDEVFGMTGMKFGAHAEYIAIKENAVVELKPVNASFEDAAAIVFGGSTAIHFLQKAKIDRLQKPRVLIYGASGSVGTSAIQIAKSYGAIVTAVCSEAGLDLCKRLGATTVMNYKQQDFTKAEQKYDIIFDTAGKLKKRDCAHCLEQEGVFKTVGGLEVAAETKEQLMYLKNLYESNQLLPVIDKIFEFNKIQEAHRYVDTGRKKGNVVLKMC